MKCPKCGKRIKLKKEMTHCPGCGADLTPTAEGETADSKAADEKSVDGKAADGKEADGKTADSKAADGKEADGKAADSKAADDKKADDKTADSKGADSKAADDKTEDAKKDDSEIPDTSSQDPDASDAESSDEALSDEEEDTEKKRSKKPLIIAIVCILIIGIGAAAAFWFLRSKGGSPTVRAAAEEDAKMFNARNWKPFLGGISTDDWKLIYDHYKDRLAPVGIKNASKLREEVLSQMRTMGDSSKVQSIEILDEHETDDGVKPGLEENVSSDEFYLASKKLAGQWVNETLTEGETKAVMYYYYEQDGKWYSGTALKLAAESAKQLGNDGRDNDIESAEKIAKAVQKVLKSEKVRKALTKFTGEILIMAKSGKTFSPVENTKLKSFAEMVNKNLAGEYSEGTPQFRHTGTSAGWQIKAWAIAVDAEGNPVVYVTDGTTENKMEIYPNVDENY